MHFLHAQEEKEAWHFIEKAVFWAKKATCQRAKCGTVIVNNNTVIGKGFNSPPRNLESQRRCNRKHELHETFKSDKTCCIHAEQRAVMDAMQRNPQRLKGSRLYFIRLDKNNKPQPAGKPYCTHCSKIALDAGVDEFVLWHLEGVCVYNTEEYNDISFNFKGD